MFYFLLAKDAPVSDVFETTARFSTRLGSLHYKHCADFFDLYKGNCLVAVPRDDGVTLTPNKER